MSQFQKTSAAVGQSSASLVSTPASAARQPVVRTEVNFRIPCPNCGTMDFNGQISVPASSLSRSPQSPATSSPPQSLSPEMVAQICEPVTRCTPLRECRMAGVPIVTPKRTTTPVPFRSRTEERLRMRRARKLGLNDGMRDQNED
jgi:hypothetical protein